jgi:hypothetical protein
MVAISSARRAASWSGTSSALTDTFRWVVAARTAVATVSGECMKPSSAPWCSERPTPANPRSSAHRAIAKAWWYCSACVSVPPGGMRRS